MKTHRTPKLTDLEIARKWEARWAAHHRFIDWVTACATRRVRLPGGYAHIVRCPHCGGELAVFDQGGLWPRVRCGFCALGPVALVNHINHLLETA